MSEAKCLDVRGLLCPVPVIRTQQVVRLMAVGERMWIVATDPGVMHDVPAWCRVHGHKVVEQVVERPDYRVLIEVGRRNN
ncbi:MAG: sulfurtransferase TusA family protein [Pseudomonadales bacterium]|nr:sulfurtransferase TusA family protein [Pseudomonadales bacterium]